MDMENESSPRRKRARRAIASVSSAVKRLAAENKKVTFKFVEGGSVHSLPWTELLTMDETPFVSIDDVTEGMNVMAPWYDDDSITIQHAQAVIVGQGRKKSSSRGGIKAKTSLSEVNTSESTTCKGSASVSTPVKSSTCKKISPSKQKLRRSPRKVVDKKKAQEQGLQTTSASLLEEFEKDNPTIEKSQIISDGTVSPDPPTSTTSSKYHIQPPAITDQSPSIDLNASTVKPTSLQVYPNTGTSPQIGSGSSLSDKDGESSIIPNAMNILLNMDDTDISQELMVYESEGVDSEASPNSSLSFSTPSYTSPNFATNRSFSLPPRNFHSHMWRGSGRYRQYSDYDGSSSDCSSVSSYYPPRPPDQPDLNYVYMHWIEPIREQLNRLERRFEQLSAPTPATVLPKLPRSAPSSSQSKSSKSKPSFSTASSTPSFSAASSPAGTLSSNDFPPISDDILEDETVDGCGTFLGYSKSPKYREWTNDLSAEDLRKIEVGSKCAEDLAKALFVQLFKQDLEERPDDICATSNRLEGRQLCDPIKMRAIRLHVSRKYNVGKFGADEESKRWDDICKKFNGHIRYRRSTKKKQ